jgi:Signal peptidase, peptidase S26
MSKGLTPSFFLAVLITALAAIAGAEEASECCFRMGSVSMKPTLFAADNFAAIKYATASDLKRGDIVIFRVPRDESVTNRDDSTDSRVLSHVGHIPFRNIIGRAIRTSRTEEKPVRNHAVICLGLAPTTAA